MSQLNAQRQRTQVAVEQLSQQLYDQLSQSTLKHWLQDDKVAKKLDQKVQEWAFQAKSNLDQQHPYLDAQQQLEHWLNLAEFSVVQLKQLMDEYADFNQSLGQPELTEYWQVQNDIQLLSPQNIAMQAALVKQKWQRKLMEAVAHWEFEQLSLQRDAFLEEMKDFLATLAKMAKYQDSLGFETGIFIDYSKGQLTEQDMQHFEQWASCLEQDAELKRLCRQIGSAQPHKPRKRLNAQLSATPEQYVEQWAQEEITGIKLAQDLSLALPSELALLADPDLQILFDLKFLEANLMSFNMQGQQHGRVIENQQQKRQRMGQKGPMLICLDTSGSMNGQPELISKAICLYLSMQALREKRAMYIVNFSTNITALNVQRDGGLDDVIHFLAQSFHSGTDILPAMNHAVEMLKQPEFSHADVVVISDFIMGQLTDELMQEISQHKEQGNGFYAVAIGNIRLDHLDESLFDHQWIYQSNRGEVVQLH